MKTANKQKIEYIVLTISSLAFIIVIYSLYFYQPKPPTEILLTDEILEVLEEDLNVNDVIKPISFMIAEQKKLESLANTNHNPFLLPQWLKAKKIVLTSPNNININHDSNGAINIKIENKPNTKIPETETAEQSKTPVNTETEIPKKDTIANDNPKYLSLKGTFIDNDVKFAIINNTIYSIGSAVDGYTLLSIQPRKVILLKNNQRFWIEINE